MKSSFSKTPWAPFGKSSLQCECYVQRSCLWKECPYICVYTYYVYENLFFQNTTYELGIAIPFFGMVLITLFGKELLTFYSMVYIDNRIMKWIMILKLNKITKRKLPAHTHPLAQQVRTGHGTSVIGRVQPHTTYPNKKNCIMKESFHNWIHRNETLHPRHIAFLLWGYLVFYLFLQVSQVIACSFVYFPMILFLAGQLYWCIAHCLVTS